MFSLLVGAHLIGDFLLQNDWMQRKSQNSLVCAVHVLVYQLPFLLLQELGLVPWWMVCLIVLQHYYQDRFSLHLKWMKLYRQTPPKKWPAGPLFVDQALHIGFIWLLCLL